MEAKKHSTVDELRCEAIQLLSSELSLTLILSVGAENDHKFCIGVVQFQLGPVHPGLYDGKEVIYRSV